MLNRLSANTLLKSVVAVLAAIVVTMLAFGAWQSWVKLQSAGRIVAVADAASSAFRAMHNLRTDRSTTTRSLDADKTIGDQDMQAITRNRGAEMPALQNALALLPESERLVAIHGLYSTVVEVMSAALLHPFDDKEWTRPFEDLLARLTGYPSFTSLSEDVSVMEREVTLASTAFYARLVNGE